MREKSREDLEIEFLLRAILEQYGYDFRNYANASLRRRVLACVSKERLRSVTELVDRVLHEPEFFPRVLEAMTVTVTEFFRDPAAYRVLREQVLPYLKTYPELKIWHAGCATGEEVYSLAILLKEAGLDDRTLLYGTDINQRALASAREGIFDEESIAEAEENYRASGGVGTLSRYFTLGYGAAILDPALRKNVVFADHNLVTDGQFGEMNLVVCRNVLIYFAPPLQERVTRLLWDSLRIGGFLWLGSRERLDRSDRLPGCKIFSAPERLFQKKA